jgi:pyrroloquinoline quinone (PQQ) biosynthesis protein C
VPSAYPESRYLINQIVLGEESDVCLGRHLSHFEIYLEAMRASGANTASIERMLELLSEGRGLEEALRESEAPSAAAAFVSSTFRFIASGKLHVLAAAFTFGREDLIPDMFRSFLRDLDGQHEGQLEIFLWYLERHIEVDGEEHGPMALRMVAELCEADPLRWQEAREAVEQALHARLALWDAIAAEVQSRQKVLSKS